MLLIQEYLVMLVEMIHLVRNKNTSTNTFKEMFQPQSALSKHISAFLPSSFRSVQRKITFFTLRLIDNQRAHSYPRPNYLTLLVIAFVAVYFII